MDKIAGYTPPHLSFQTVTPFLPHDARAEFTALVRRVESQDARLADQDRQIKELTERVERLARDVRGLDSLKAY